MQHTAPNSLTHSFKDHSTMISSVLEILSQEARPISEQPYAPDWIVHNIHLTKEGESLGARAPYPFAVDITNRNNGQREFWRVPAVLSWRYDFTNAAFDSCRCYAADHYAVIYGQRVEVRILKDHGTGTIDVERVSDGQCFRVSGLAPVGWDAV